MPKWEEVIQRLREATSDPSQLVPAFKALEALVYNDKAEYQQLPERTREVLANLAYDLDFFEPNEDWRREDPSFYSSERAVEEIRFALARLDNQGTV